MAWLEGSASREFEIGADIDEVAAYFANPEKFEHCLDDLETLESVGENQWKFTLQELSAKGVSFQGEYTVEYHRDDHRVRWESTGEGNMKSEGYADLEESGDATRVDYEETISVELPIPGLMTKVFNPIVSREVRKSVGSMLDCSKETLESVADG